jgi:hypothetical protein
MKAMLALALAASFAHAAPVASSKEKVSPARVVAVKNLVDNDGLKVNLVTEDLGGSTDVSNTQVLWLTLYLKGEMFSTDAAFKVGEVIKLNSARRTAAGLYEVKALVINDEGVVNKTISIDARQATVAIRAVSCEDFDCAASANFAATVNVR